MNSDPKPETITITPADRQLLDALDRATCSHVDEHGARCGRPRVDAPLCDTHRHAAQAIADRAAEATRAARELGARVRARLMRSLEQRERQNVPGSAPVHELAQVQAWMAEDRELLKLSDVELAKHAKWSDR